MNGWRRNLAIAIAAVAGSMRRGLSENTNPMASAPASTAVSTSCSVLRPQIFTKSVMPPTVPNSYV